MDVCLQGCRSVRVMSGIWPYRPWKMPLQEAMVVRAAWYILTEDPRTVAKSIRSCCKRMVLCVVWAGRETAGTTPQWRAFGARWRRNGWSPATGAARKPSKTSMSMSGTSTYTSVPMNRYTIWLLINTIKQSDSFAVQIICLYKTPLLGVQVIRSFLEIKKCGKSNKNSAFSRNYCSREKSCNEKSNKNTIITTNYCQNKQIQKSWWACLCFKAINFKHNRDFIALSNFLSLWKQ